jgi:hypothetical protein
MRKSDIRVSKGSDHSIWIRPSQDGGFNPNTKLPAIFAQRATEGSFHPQRDTTTADAAKVLNAGVVGQVADTTMGALTVEASWTQQDHVSGEAQNLSRSAIKNNILVELWIIHEAEVSDGTDIDDSGASVPAGFVRGEYGFVYLNDLNRAWSTGDATATTEITVQVQGGYREGWFAPYEIGQGADGVKLVSMKAYDEATDANFVKTDKDTDGYTYNGDGSDTYTPKSESALG